jgi:TRAP-type uncharacterized transport system fused permease subunit
MGELLAALYTATLMLALLLATFLVFKHVRKDPVLQNETLLGNLRIAIETHAEMTSYLALLLATLGIMIGLFTVTGFINRMGGMLLDLGAWNVTAMVFMAWIFGWLAGAGLPPTATYIIGAVVIVRPLQELGINPWVAHFFVFLLSVWGELSPPTSLTAAVSARIANASFLRTMYEALKICAPITFMTFAIFARSEMVISPGWAQVLATVLVLIGTSGVAIAMFGRFLARPASDIPVRCGLAALSFVVMLHPSQTVALLVAAAVVPFALIGIWRHQSLAAPELAQPSEAVAAPAGDLAELVAEAKREL